MVIQNPNVHQSLVTHGYITLVLARWEGSSHDAMVLKEAQTKGLKIPHSKFVLGDAGYRALSLDILIPYARV